MLSIDEIRDALRRDGYAVQDALLPWAVFDDLDGRVLESWRNRIGWNTSVKGPGPCRHLPLQLGDSARPIADLVDRVTDGGGDSFTYLYHQLRKDQDESGLVRRIEEVTCDAWREAISHLVGPFERTSFSLTAFTPGCRLEPHTDHGGKDVYRLTILLYFTGTGTGTVPLMFGDSKVPAIIKPTPNRSVIFVPSTASTHWIDRVPFNGDHTVRLAFSGWLL